MLLGEHVPQPKYDLDIALGLDLGTSADQRLGEVQAAAAQRRDAVQAEREVALRDLAALQSDIQARTRAFEQLIAALKDAKDQLSAQFSEIGGRLLESAQTQFLSRADQRFAQAHEKSEAQLRTLLNPVETTLKRYEEGLARGEKDRVGSDAELREASAMVHAGQGQVREETAKLVNALRAAPKTRGRWGEQQFKNLIETAGLSPFVDFQEEVSVMVEDGRLRPDFIIRLPGDQQLVVEGAMVQVIEGRNEPGRPARGDEYAIGVRYQRPLDVAWIFRADAMHGWRVENENIAGVRIELRRKF